MAALQAAEADEAACKTTTITTTRMEVVPGGAKGDRVREEVAERASSSSSGTTTRITPSTASPALSNHGDHATTKMSTEVSSFESGSGADDLPRRSLSEQSVDSSTLSDKAVKFAEDVQFRENIPRRRSVRRDMMSLVRDPPVSVDDPGAIIARRASRVLSARLGEDEEVDHMISRPSNLPKQDLSFSTRGRGRGGAHARNK